MVCRDRQHLPLALYRLLCALGQHSLVTVLTRCRLSLPVYILADEKHSRCLTDKVYLPTIVSKRVIWHLGYSESKSAVAFTASYSEFQRTALEHEPSYRVQGALTDGFDSTTKSMRTLFPGARLGTVRQGLRSKFHTLLRCCRQRKSIRVVSLGQRLRRFADHITATAGKEHGERVRNWFQEKLRREAVWRNVVTPEGIQVPSESLGLSIVGHAMM